MLTIILVLNLENLSSDSSTVGYFDQIIFFNLKVIFTIKSIMLFEEIITIIIPSTFLL